ncbi:MAG: hypothetical protein HY755_06605 [Nitrospirae bacterium]|nr:hypothetical protein [Nitrospirota bacterium]
MQEDSSQNFDIKQYWAVVLKRKYLALSAGLIVLSAFTWGSFVWPKTYEANSTVFIERSSVMDPLIKGVGVSSSMEERLKILKESITTRNIIDRVIKKLDLDVNIKNSKKYEEFIDNIKENLNVKIKSSRGRGDEMAQLFNISYKGKDPKTVRDMVNTLVSEYIEENMSYKRTDTSSAYEFINSQLLEYKKKLDESDKAIREFREKHPNMIPKNETTLLGRVENFEAAIIETEIRLKESMRRRDNLQKQLSGEKELTVTMITKESPQARLNNSNNQLMLLMTKYTDSYPEIIKTKNEIEELKKQIAQAKVTSNDNTGSETATTNPVYQQLREDIAKTEAEVESLKARNSELIRQQKIAQGVLGRMPKEQEEWAKFQRDRNVYQKIYDDLLQKLENARVSKELETADKTANFKIVDPAVFPNMPVSPDRVKMILLGIFLGVAFGIGIAFGLEYLNPSFKDENSIETRYKLPVFAVIPQIITEEDRLSAKMLNRKIFAAAGAYLFIIILVLAREVLNRYLGIAIINF